MREWLEYAVVWALLKALGALPRQFARDLAATAARWAYALLPKLRKTAEFNLRLAFPEWDDAQRQATIRGMVRNLGWMAAEFARLPRYTKENIEQVVILDGHENFLEGQRRGKGVLYLTGHIGAWELSSFAHALYGFPLHYMARPLDNARIDALVNRYRCLSGNRPVFKNESARALLKILRGFFRHASLYDDRSSTRGLAYRRSRGAWVCLLGCANQKIPPAIRATRRAKPKRRLRARCLGKYRKVCEGDRGDHP
jgi:KDO2-lipid IV(A) lauroyltransferase